MTNVPHKLQLRLWGKAAGRCQYAGCNKPLWLDSLTKFEFNIAYAAHIIADRPGGPRGDKDLSEKLCADLSNLMLLCDEHHRLIDREDVLGHPVERLRKMKRMHEERIELLSSVTEEKRSHVLLYGANIGQNTALLSWEKAARAMTPTWYPLERPALELNFRNSSFQDHEDTYWVIEQENLRRQFAQVVKPRLAHGSVQHLSVFGIAPQPLLMELGRLLSDIPTAEVYQLHREPPDWRWQDHPADFNYFLDEPADRKQNVAINLSLSANIDNARIHQVLGKEVSIWTIRTSAPGNDFLKSRQQLSMFRQIFRQLLNRIKAEHGEAAALSIFPAVPVAVAIEMGRVWMPKADLAMHVFDQNRAAGGFVKCITLCNTV